MQITVLAPASKNIYPTNSEWQVAMKTNSSLVLEFFIKFYSYYLETN